MDKRTFAEILEEKLQPDPLAQREKPPYIQTSAPSWGQWELPITEPRKQFSPGKIPYPKAKPVAKPTQPCRPKLEAEPPRVLLTLWQLPPQAQEAFRQFNALGGRLDRQDINVAAIKKEFRRLAKVYHPDHQTGQGSQAGTFILLKKLESLLSRAVNELRQTEN